MIRRLPGILAALLFAAPAIGAEPLVSPDWLAAHLTDPNVVVLDIRPAAETTAGHIQGAVPADYEKAGWREKQSDGAGGALPPVERISALIGGLGVGDASQAVIVSDDFGAAARVYWTFKVLGHQDVSILDGGWTAWKSAGLPVSTATVTPHPASFTAHYDPSIRAGIAEVEQELKTGSALLVDARPTTQWLGLSKSPAVKAYGHLPGAVWIDQSDALTANGTKLKPKAELAALFARTSSKPVTAYCNTGHLAATDWFVLSEVLNRKDTKLYDASLSQWTNDDSRPVVR